MRMSRQKMRAFSACSFSFTLLYGVAVPVYEKDAILALFFDIAFPGKADGDYGEDD